MRRLAFLVSLVAVVVGLLTVGVRSGVVAQEETPAATVQHPLVGTWLFTFPAESGMTPALVSYTDDGVLIQNELDGTSANGVWEATGERTARITLVFLAEDEAGGFAGAAKVRGEAEVDETGDGLTGEFTVEGTMTDGSVFPVGEGTAQGLRIAVEGPEAMGTPMAGIAGIGTPTP